MPQKAILRLLQLKRDEAEKPPKCFPASQNQPLQIQTQVSFPASPGSPPIRTGLGRSEVLLHISAGRPNFAQLPSASNSEGGAGATWAAFEQAIRHCVINGRRSFLRRPCEEGDQRPET